MKHSLTKYANDKSGIFALIALAFVFSMFGAFGRYFDNYFTVFQQMYIRTFIAALLSFIIFRKEIRLVVIRSLPRKEWLILFVRAIFLYGFASWIYLQAMFNTTYSNATFLTAIPTIAILGILFMQERLTWQKVGIIILAFIGVGFISIDNPSDLFNWGRGEVYAIIADVFFSLAFISRKWHGNYLNNKEITTIILAFAFVITLGISIVYDHSLPQLPDATIVYLALAVVSAMTVISQILMNYGFQHVKPFLANNIIALETIFAVCIGLFIFAEVLLPREILGSLLILVSIPLMNWIEEREKKL